MRTFSNEWERGCHMNAHKAALDLVGQAESALKRFHALDASNGIACAPEWDAEDRALLATAQQALAALWVRAEFKASELEIAAKGRA